VGTVYNRYMARPLRIHYAGAWYHITCRGNEKSPIFRDNKDRQKFLELLGERSQEFSLEVHSYCLMDNHFHFLLRTLLPNLARFMQRFNTAYIMYFNKRHDRAGHLYQGRYKAILVDADSYLLELSRYIHLNPVRLRRFEGVPFEEKVKALEQYPWSSYGAYIGKQGPAFLHKEMILGMIGGKDRYRHYREFVLNGLREGICSPLTDKKAQTVLGDDNFIAWVYKEHVKGRECEKEYSKMHEIVPELTVERIAQEVARRFGVKPGEFLQRYARGQARQALVELSCRHVAARVGMRGIAKRLGVSVAALHLSRQRFRKRLMEERVLRRRFAEVEATLRE